VADPIQLLNAAMAHKGLSHQIAAWRWLQEDLSANRPEALAEFAELFRADPPAKPEPSPTPGVDWLTLCLPLVKEFEGCRLEAYLCPAGVWTIGWGHTGPEVKQGLQWSQQQADAALAADLREAHAGMLQALPMARSYSGPRQAALTSWVFNVGAGAAADSTLRRRLAAGEDPVAVVREELPRWNKGGGGVLPGLVRRRAAEVALFAGGPAGAVTAGSVLLQVPYEGQSDNASGQGYRECFSSSCAMVARFYGKVASDDAYNQIRARFGDSTDSGAQLRALGSLGLQAQFRQNGDAATLERILREGRPVPVGWLHKGPATAPSGGGHWSVVVGFTADAFIHNDPNGEADMVNGGYVTTKGAAGKGIAYSRKNWLRRWEADGKGSGWYLDVRG
jgi:GH24 family phage-related lysozyme (muramidase)